MVKQTQTIRRQQPTNYLSMFDHFAGLALKGLMKSMRFSRKYLSLRRWCFASTSVQICDKAYTPFSY